MASDRTPEEEADRPTSLLKSLFGGILMWSVVVVAAIFVRQLMSGAITEAFIIGGLMLVSAACLVTGSVRQVFDYLSHKSNTYDDDNAPRRRSSWHFRAFLAVAMGYIIWHIWGTPMLAGCLLLVFAGGGLVIIFTPDTSPEGDSEFPISRAPISRA